jgi:hypothetical protein
MKNIINGINLQLAADYVIEQNRQDDLKNIKNRSVIWCKTDYLGELFYKIKDCKERVVLITHCSDHAITENVFKHKPNCVFKWFAQNVDYKHPDLIPVPIGVENHHGPSKGSYTDFIILQKNAFDFKLRNKIINKIYINFNSATHPNRVSVKNTLLKNNMGTPDTRSEYEQYVKNMKEFLFVASPRGNGIDTHRVWESLYFGCIPIVDKHFMYDGYDDLPLIQVTDWNSVNNDLFMTYIEKYKINSCFKNTERLNLNYWIDLIKTTSTQI